MITTANPTLAIENTATDSSVLKNTASDVQFEVKESDIELDGNLVIEFDQEPLTDINFGF